MPKDLIEFMFFNEFRITLRSYDGTFCAACNHVVAWLNVIGCNIGCNIERATILILITRDATSNDATLHKILQGFTGAQDPLGVVLL